MKLIKFLFFSVLTIVTLAVVAAFVFMQWIEGDRIKQLLVEKVQSETGRTLTIEGEVSPTLGLRPTLAINDVTLSNPKWAKTPHLIKAKSLELALELLPLIDGDVQIVKIAVSGADINLESAGGKQTWSFEKPEPAKANKEEPAKESKEAAAEKEAVKEEKPATKKSANAFRIDEIELSDSTLNYVSGKKSHKVEISELSVKELEHNLVGDIQLKGKYNNAAITASGSLVEKNVLLVKLAASAERYSADIDGSVSLSDMTFDAQLNAKASQLKDLMGLVQAKSNDASPFEMKAKLGGTADVISFSNMILQYGTHGVTGSGRVTLSGAKPYLKASLAMDTLDLKSTSQTTGANANPETGGGAPTQAAAKPEKEISTEALDGLNADVNLKVATVALDATSLKDVSAGISLKNKRLHIEPFKANTAKGWIEGTATFDGAQAVPAVSLNVLTKDVILGDLLKEMANEDSVQGGIIKSSLNIKGQGKTVNAILGSASGDFDFFVDEAVYHTPEVDKAQSFLDVLRGEGDSKDKLNVSCMVGQFDIASGVAKSKMLAFKTAGAVTSGDGTIKLNDSTMDIVLKARSGLVGLADVVPPLRMTGPISNPSVSVDPAGSLIGLGKLFLGATTGVGLVAVLGEQATDKLGITSDSNPCLKSMAEMEAKENEAKQNPKKAYKKIEDNVREKRDEIKEDVKHDLKKLESNAKQIRDGLKSLLKKK